MTTESIVQGVVLAGTVIHGPWPVLETFFGAALGACLVVSTRRTLKGWQTLCILMMYAGVGALFSPLAIVVVPELTRGVAAFLCALVVIPLSIKLMVWVKKLDVLELIERIRGRR